MDSLDQVKRETIACTKCPRLVEYRQSVARKKPPRYRDWEYWAKPVPSFGDPQARVVVIGLAPAAHGGNRTGRVFTGDRSGDWLYGTLHKFGFASSPTSVRADDGMELRELYITAAVHCAPPKNKPLPEEFRNCRPYLVRELGLLDRVQVVVALGKIAFDTYLTVCREAGVNLARPFPAFRHGGVYHLANGVTLIASYHPSQQNTQTGKLTREMFEDIFKEARRLLLDGGC